MTNKTNPKLSFLRRNLKGCPEKFKQTTYFFLIAHLWSMAPLFGTHTKSTTVIRFIKSRHTHVQYTLVFLVCLMSCGGRLFLNGDKRLSLLCFTKLLTVWHKCPLKASLLRRIRALEENTKLNLDSMDSRFSLKLLVHGTNLL